MAERNLPGKSPDTSTLRISLQQYLESTLPWPMDGTDLPDGHKVVNGEEASMGPKGTTYLPVGRPDPTL